MGGSALAKVLEINTVLERLFLDKNLISNLGAIAFAKALEKNKRLSELRLCIITILNN